MVEQRTAQLQKAKQELLDLNMDLETKVKQQVLDLERHNELRRYLSPQLTDQILKSGHAFGEEPERKMMTVVFTDIRGFSRITDCLESEELFHLLDGYLSEMIGIVHRHDGTLNKILGDGLLILFGDPVPMEDHAQRAVHMAVDMQSRVSAIKGEWSQYGHELGIGIGINTGFVTVGNIGSDSHRDYTVIGNQVNVAARLQAIASPGQILISQRTFSRVRDAVKSEEMGEIRVKGIHTPVRTYRVIWD
jgi:class 3 adenylate cyclase